MAATALAKPKQLWEVLPNGRLEVNPHPGQWKAWKSQARFILVLAGSQGGKTSWGPLWLYREIKDCGPGDYIAATASFPLLKLKMLPEFLKFFDQTMQLGRWYAGDKVYEFHGGETRVIFGTASHPESLESATAKGGWLDECGQDDFKLQSYEAVQRRMTLNKGRLLLTTTPYNLGWLKQQVYDRWRAGDRDYDVIQFESVMNPMFPKDEFERLHRTMPSWKFDLFLRGIFSRPAGLIYSDFIDAYREEGGHKVHPFDIPPAWPRWGGFDFGGVNTARLMITQDPASRVYYLYNEYHDGGKTSAEHAAAALEIVRGTNIVGWWGGSGSEDQQRRDFTAAGIAVQEPPLSQKGAGTGAQGIVEAGIDRVIAMFKAMELYVFDSCVGVLDELGTYARELDPVTLEPTEKIKDKASFHRLDSLRYLVDGMKRPRGGIFFA